MTPDTLTYSEARGHFKDVLDAAARGLPVVVRRERDLAAVVDVRRMLRLLERMCPRAKVVRESGGWSLFLPGVPVAADAATFDEAVDDMVDALREYVEDWRDHLMHARNHEGNWPLVHLISMSDDEQLRDWLVGSAA